MNSTDDKSSRPQEGFESEFENLYKAGLKELTEGELVKGRIVKITDDSVVVDIGFKSEGVVPLREFIGRDGKPAVAVGDEISVLLEKLEDDLGYVVLSKARADQLKVWDDIIESGDRQKILDGTIVKSVKGGFYVDIKGIQAFLPSSQVDLKPVKDPSSLIGKSFKFLVIKYNRRKDNVIVSRRVILEEKRDVLRKETLEKISEGAIVDGVVKNITDYGAFVDLGGVDGLVHLSDLSWGKVSHPSQVLKIGEGIKVKILKFDRAENKISLGFKQTKADPWLTAKEKYQVGAKVRGRVVNITDYGAFVEIEDGLEGLVHISEMAWTKIRHPSQKLKVGDTVEVMVLDMDAEAKRLSMGLKQVEPNPWDELASKYPPGSHVKGVIRNITDFGMFVGVEEGIDGLVHISDVSWKKIKHPSELFKKGDEVSAVVLSIDKDSHRFSLSTKLLEKNPWHDVAERYKPGMIVRGRVTGLADFGAFVEIEEGLEGLVHVSELSRGRQKGRAVTAGDIVEVEILNVNPDERKIGLSIRSVESASAGAESDGAPGQREDTAGTPAVHDGQPAGHAGPQGAPEGEPEQ
ncbi:MAG: 30S ribosomal protein S1 [Deltaproteobacteria bacterium]|nr:30S ribosomal protein S1 [Deltaproteobacteria bacterium]